MPCESGLDLFKGVTNIGDTLLLNELETNLKYWSDWAFLKIGGWFDATLSAGSIDGGYFDQLRHIEGSMWESRRKDLVWETGVNYTYGSGINNPLTISGVYINNNFYGTGDITYGHYINFPEGRVVFQNSINPSAIVRMEHSYRWVQVYKANSVPWWRELQYNTFDTSNIHFPQLASGDWSILAENRVQLPAVVIEAVPRRISRGYELGSSSLTIYQDVVFHILAENSQDRNQLCDIFALQKDKTIWLFDSDKLVGSGDYPLDYRGMVVQNPRMYSDIIQDYYWKRAIFSDTNLSEVESPNPYLHEGAVRATLEIIYGI